MLKGKNILIIAPHSDDEILGCGGTIAKYIEQKANVFVLILTNGHVGAPELYSEERVNNVRNEALESHEYLGVTETIFFDFPAPRLDSIPSYKISKQIDEFIREKNIDTIFIPHRGDIHKDHRITFEAAIVAGRPISNSPVKRIYAYETLSETEWAAPFSDDAFIPNLFIDISGFIDIKNKAFEYFTIQIKQKPHSRSIWGIESLARFRGSTIGVNFAEAFMLIREISD